MNVGSEQDGNKDNFERPVIIIKKLSSTTFICAPLSTKKKVELFQSEITHDNVNGYALLDQIKVLDRKRLLRKIGSVKIYEFDLIKNKIKEMFL